MGLTLYHLVLHLTANFIFYSSRLTFNFQFFNFFQYSSGLTLGCQFKQVSIHSTDSIALVSLSCKVLFPFKEHFFFTFSSVFFTASHVVSNYTFSFFFRLFSFSLLFLHCSDPIDFSFFFSKMHNMQYTNIMISLTNTLCNHCALTCYW